MLYGGALASGALAGRIALLGHRFASGLARATSPWSSPGSPATPLGAVGGWLDRRLRRPSAARALRPLRPRHAAADRARRALVRALRGRRGSARLRDAARPLVRRHPGGHLRGPLRRFLAPALAGIAAFCFAVAGIGWAVGASWHGARGDARLRRGRGRGGGRRSPSSPGSSPARRRSITMAAVPPIPHVDVKAQYAPFDPGAAGGVRADARERTVHPRARGRGRSSARRPRASAPSTRSASPTAPTRSCSCSTRSGSARGDEVDLPRVHLLRDRRGDRAHRARRRSSPTSTR